jgi:hypothetical protein
VSLQRLKAAFETSAAAMPAEDRAAMWRRMVEFLIAEAGGRTLYWYVPTDYFDDELLRRQGELFDSCDGLSVRAAAEKAHTSKDAIHRHRQCRKSRAFSATAA